MEKQLNQDWLTEGLVDFEYKKYVLLAYLQDVKSSFHKEKLYPQLSDLVFHYQNLLSVKKNQELLYENFPKSLSQADFKNLKLQYRKAVENDELMKELEDIIEYAIPQFKQILSEGKDLYEYVEKNMEIHTIGISPISKEQGYVFLDEDPMPEMKIYEYQITLFENANERFRGIHINYLESVRKSIGKTFEKVKIELVKKRHKLPNPATFAIYSKVHFPLNETLLPVAKRALVQYISTAA